MCEQFKSLLIKYLREAGVFTEDEVVWDIVHKEPFGRCLVAKRDIEVNELILYDAPLLIGPRTSNYDKIFCVSCYKVLPKLALCENKCKYPVCNDCVDSKRHRQECELIRSWGLRNVNRYSKYLFRALTVIRGLLLSSDDTKLMLMMACHDNSTQQNIEVDRIVDEFEGMTLECDIIQKLKKISSILNTNAFEVGIAFDAEQEHNISLRVSKKSGSFLMTAAVPTVTYGFVVVHCRELNQFGSCGF
jgi:hypothetical protein